MRSKFIRRNMLRRKIIHCFHMDQNKRGERGKESSKGEKDRRIYKRIWNLTLTNNQSSLESYRKVSILSFIRFWLRTSHWNIIWNLSHSNTGYPKQNTEFLKNSILGHRTKKVTCQCKKTWVWANFKRKNLTILPINSTLFKLETHN